MYSTKEEVFHLEPIKTKLAAWAQDKPLVRIAAAVAAALVLLIALLCISNHMRSNIQREYSALTSHLQEQIYHNLSEMQELFDRVDDPNVDVRNKLIPELKIQFSAVKAANSALLECCGAEKAVLNDELTSAFESAFEEYAVAYRQGIATGLAKADMAECMQEVQLLLTAHYAPPDEEDEVVIINASSGSAAAK